MLCLTIFAGIGVFFLINKKTEILPPMRASNIPSTARWVGGADGGSWYLIKEMPYSNFFRIKIYNERSGDVEADTIFTLNPECSVKELDSTTLVKSIVGFDGVKILLNLPDKGKRCFLIVK